MDLEGKLPVWNAVSSREPGAWSGCGPIRPTAGRNDGPGVAPNDSRSSRTWAARIGLTIEWTFFLRTSSRSSAPVGSEAEQITILTDGFR